MFIRRLKKIKKWKLIITAFLVVFCFLFLFYYLLNLNMTTRAKILRQFPILYHASKVTKVLDIFYIPLMHKSSELESWNLILNEADLQKLQKGIPENFLDHEGKIDFKEVKAKLVIDGVEYKVKIRHRGTTPNHWAWDKKSWRINFNSETPYKGMDKINLVIPKDVGYVVEAFNNYRAKNLGLIVPHSDFINLKINGKNKALYYLSEKWSGDVLAKNEKPDEVNIYADEIGTYLYDDLGAWIKQGYLNSDQPNDYSDLKMLIKSFSEKDIDSFKNIVDINNFLSWTAHSILAGSQHQDNANNNTIFFNSALGKFEFIPDDVFLYELNWDINETENDLVSFVFSEEELKIKRDEILKGYLKENSIEEELKYFEELYYKIKYDLYSDRLKKYGNIISDLEYKKYKRIIKENMEKIKNIVNQ